MASSSDNPDAAGHYELEPASPSHPHPGTPPGSRVDLREAERRLLEAESREREAKEEADRLAQLRTGPDDDSPLVSDTLKGRDIIAGAAGVLLIWACVSAALHVKPGASGFAAVVAVLYNAALSTLLGTLAAWIWAKFEKRGLGPWRDVLARMFFAVCVFFLLAHQKIGLEARIEEPILAVAAYFLSLMLLMRWNPARTFRVASIHFVLTLAVFLAVFIHAWASGTRTP